VYEQLSNFAPLKHYALMLIYTDDQYIKQLFSVYF